MLLPPESDEPAETTGRRSSGDPVTRLRGMSDEELARAGEQALLEHLVAQARVAHAKYAPLSAENLDRLLADPECLRHPVRLVYEFGPMAMHQFAHPDLDWRNTEGDGRVIYLRPLLREHPERLPLAVAYMIPVVNYGDVVTDAHCLAYSATLLGLTENECYLRLCDLADLLGAEPRFPGQTGCGG